MCRLRNAITLIAATAAVVLSTVAKAPVAAANDRHSHTVLSGFIYYLDEGLYKPYPWPKQITEKSLDSVLRHLQTRVERRDVPRPVVSAVHIDDLGEIAEYELSLTPDSLSHEVIVEFRYGVFGGTAKEELWSHLGERFLHIEVEKHHSTDQMAYRSIVDTITNKNANYAELDSALETLFSLNRKGTKRHYFSDAVLLFNKIAKNTHALSDINFNTAIFIDFQNGFEDLDSEDQVRILTELGQAFSKRDNIYQHIGPDFTYFDMARHFFRKAAAIASVEVESLPARLIAQLYQSLYEIECKSGQLRDCASTIAEFFEIQRAFTARTYLAFFKEIASRIEDSSQYGIGVDSSSAAFVERAAQDPDLVDYWSSLHCIATTNSRAKQRLEASSYARDVMSRAKLIFETAGASCAA